MKVNLRKIGAVVAGAAILASSAAFGALYFGSTKLVDDNGAPIAKIVIGSSSAPSDGVAAALIAGKLASSAWTTQTLTAQTAGTPTCLASNVSATGGTCTISGRTATLDITVPGSVAAGTWTGWNLIGDYIDRTLGDRVDHSSVTSTNGYLLLGSDTSTGISPVADGTGHALGSYSGEQSLFYQVSGTAFSPFATQTVSDTEASKSYSESQALWFGGENHFDSGTNTIVGNVQSLIYQLKFDGPGSSNIGIPVCTESTTSTNTSSVPSYALCGADSGFLTASHEVNVSFLGQNWIISEMDPPTSAPLNGDGISNVSTPDQLRSGGEVKLAKESASGTLNVGQSLPAGPVSIRLDDIQAVAGTTGIEALISIVDANGAVLKQDKIPEDTTADENVNGVDYKVHVYQVAPGYTFGAKWAKMAVFSNELDLVDGQQLDQNTGDNKDYNVVLGWKTGSAAAKGDADSLRTILIYGQNLDTIASGGSANTLLKGQSMPIVENPSVWGLTYSGLNLQSSDMATLKFNLETSPKTFGSSTSGVYNTTGSGDRSNCTIFPPYMQVTSSDNTGVFTINRNDGNGASSGTLSNYQFFVPLDNQSIPAQCGVDVYPIGSVFMQESTSSSNWGVANASATTNGLMGQVTVQYAKLGDRSTGFQPGSAVSAGTSTTGSGGGAIVIEQNASMNGDDHAIGQMFNSSGLGIGNWVGTAPIYVAVAEKDGYGTSANFVDYYTFGVTSLSSGSPGDATFEFDVYNGTGTNAKHLFSSNNAILYGHATDNPATTPSSGFYNLTGGAATGPVSSTGLELRSAPYTSERGSVFQSQSTNQVAFNVAEKLGQAVWTLAPLSNASTSSVTGTVVTMTPGQVETINGVTVQLISVNESVGACNAAGAAASCNIDPTSYSAVIVPGNTPSVNVSVPYTGNYGNLVILDSNAVGVNTLVSVGGPVVNSETSSLLQGSSVDWTANPTMVKEVVAGSKIVVAGAQASDTLTAAQDFVNQLSATPTH